MTMLSQDTSRALVASLEAKDVARQKFARKPRAIEAGQITSLDLDGSTHVVPMGLLIEFESAAHLRHAIAEGRLEFSWQREAESEQRA
jgi:hypothetical protein